MTASKRTPRRVTIRSEMRRPCIAATRFATSMFTISAAGQSVWMCRRSADKVNLFIEAILRSPSEDNTFRLLREADQRIAVLYRDRLDEALLALENGIRKDAQIDIPQTWSDLLRILLLRKEP